ncbi:MAG: hypothetical protein ACRCWJ_15200 [Casimicrobium sp.]
MVTDKMIVAAAIAGRAEAMAWTVSKSPIVGTEVYFLHDANRQRSVPVDPDATYTEYRCSSRAEAEQHITAFAWRAGIEAALKCQMEQATKQ